MSCEKNSTKVCRTATKKAGINSTAAKSGFVAGSTSQVSFFAPGQMEKSQGKKTKQARGSRKVEKAVPGKGKRAKNKGAGQKLFFDLNRQKPARPLKDCSKLDQEETTRNLPTQLQVDLSQNFTPDELQTISIQLRLGGAAASRHLREVGASIRRGIGHGDPRPLDWIEADHKNFDFLVQQLSEARRGRGSLELSSLRKTQLRDLWEFCRFEADRADRNIGHLSVPGGGIGGATAEYLMSNHKLEVRFFSHIAASIERMVPYEELDENIGLLAEVD